MFPPMLGFLFRFDNLLRSRSNDPTCRVLVEEEDLFDLGREQGDDLAEHRLGIKRDYDKVNLFFDHHHQGHLGPATTRY